MYVRNKFKKNHKSISEEFCYKQEERKNKLLQKLIMNDEKVVKDEEIKN